MLPGIVSNCWRVQLDAGVPLDDLLAEASRRRYRTVELRQTCLGQYETEDDHLPIAERLQDLPSRFPEIRFNIAIDVPFLTAPFDRRDLVFLAGRQAAEALAGEFSPHLRLVDLSTSAEDFDRSDLECVGASLVNLVNALMEIDGTLSIEQSRQAWSPFHRVWDAARSLLGPDAGRLKLCYDPCNLLLSDGSVPGDDTDPNQVTASLNAETISMVHLKQRRGGQICTDVRDGEIDWRGQIANLRQIGFDGPTLFEVAPHQRVWESLDDSIDFLRQEGLDLTNTDR